MRIINRIILFPAILILYTAHSIVGLGVNLYCFLRYGGEIVPYRKGDDARTVLDTYLKLQEFLNREEGQSLNPDKK